MKKVFITGFGPFGGITNNPSSIVGRLLQQELQKENINAQFEEVQVSRRACDDFYERYGHEKDCLYVHIGVNEGASGIECEYRAVNNASFSIPDVDGDQPINKSINDEQPLNSALINPLPIKSYVKTIGPPLRLSGDAGKYICNYMYYRALQNHSKACIFIHVPTFTTIFADSQVMCITNLINLILAQTGK